MSASFLSRLLWSAPAARPTDDLDWDSFPRLPSESRPATLTLTPIPDVHWDRSRAMIAEQVHALPAGGRAQVLGAGRCRDIPLRLMVDRFAETVLWEIEAERLRAGLAEAGVTPDARRVRAEIRDLSGAAETFRPAAVAAVAGASDLRSAVGRLGQLMTDTQPPSVGLPAGAFDLTVCSGVLTQINAPLWRIAHDALTQRFGPELDAELIETLRRQQRDMGHRFRRQLVEQLHQQTRPAGRIYLADTMRVAHLETGPSDRWTIRGAYRMGQCQELCDYLDKRFLIHDRRAWTWVDLDGSGNGGARAASRAGGAAGGRLWRVEALALSRRADHDGPIVA